MRLSWNTSSPDHYHGGFGQNRKRWYSERRLQTGGSQWRASGPGRGCHPRAHFSQLPDRQHSRRPEAVFFLHHAYRDRRHRFRHGHPGVWRFRRHYRHRGHRRIHLYVQNQTARQRRSDHHPPGRPVWIAKPDRMGPRHQLRRMLVRLGAQRSKRTRAMWSARRIAMPAMEARPRLPGPTGWPPTAAPGATWRSASCATNRRPSTPTPATVWI